MALAGLAAGASVAVGATATTSLAPRGAWSWFSDPRAIQFGRYTVFGFVDGRGDVRIRAYGAGSLRGTVLQHRVGKDDHLNPAFLVRRDGRLQAFWTRHGKSHIYYRVARRPGQVMGFGPVHRLRPQHHAHFTYANPMYARGRILLFFRGRGRDPALTTSRDGAHWSRGQRMLSAPGPRRPYVKYATNGSDVFMAFTQAHPGELHKRPTGIFFARFRRGSFFTAAGAPLGKPPLRPQAAQPVYHGKDPAWIYDLALDGRGRPVIVYAVLHNSRDHRYRYAAWDGHRWRDHHITGAGPHISRQRAGHVIETRYSAGVTLDHQNPAQRLPLPPGRGPLRARALAHRRPGHDLELGRGDPQTRVGQPAPGRSLGPARPRRARPALDAGRLPQLPDLQDIGGGPRHGHGPALRSGARLARSETPHHIRGTS